MPDEIPEPPHPLEASLRTQAARRRSELGSSEPAMPGPMRAQLHDEAARAQTRGERAREAQPGLLAWLFQWQRALATVGVGLVVIGFFAWNDGWFSHDPAPLAKQAAPPAAPAANESSVAQAPTSEMDRRLDAKAATTDDKEQSKPAPIGAPADAVAAGKLEDAPKADQPAAPAVATAHPVPGAPASEPRAQSFASKKPAESNGLRQSFANTVAPGAENARRAAGAMAKEKRAEPLLNEFEFRQDGNRVEIIDADGSVYAGEIDTNEKKQKDRGLAAAGRDETAAAAKLATKSLPNKAKNAEVAAEFNFRASGMNHTLRQKVTIEGMYQAPALAESQNAPAGVATGGTSVQDAMKSARPASIQQNQAQSRARVVGRAQVNGRDVELNAEATK